MAEPRPGRGKTGRSRSPGSGDPRRPGGATGAQYLRVAAGKVECIDVAAYDQPIRPSLFRNMAYIADYFYSKFLFAVLVVQLDLTYVFQK